MSKYRSKLGMAAAGVVGFVAAGAMAPAHAGDLKSKDDGCPQAAAGALKTIAAAQTDYNTSTGPHKSGKRRIKKKAAKKKAARRRAGTVLEDIQVEKEVDRSSPGRAFQDRTSPNRTAKKAMRKRPGRLKSAMPKTRKKAAKRRTARRDPC